MGQTLTHGVYLPDEGERNCYNGLAANWQLLDGAVGTVAEHTTQIAGKAPAVHTHTKSNITDLLNSNFIPSANNSYDLGSSSYQWNNIYAKNYYYNGIAWGLDKVNTWSAHQKIVGNNSRGTISIYSPTYTKGGTLSVTNLPIGSIYMGDGGQQGLANSLSFISTDLAANGAKTLLSLSVMENTASSVTRTNVVIQYDKNDTANPKKVSIEGTVTPNPDATFSLGTPTLRWKTLNGVNPGALSLPDMSATGVDISGSIVPPSGETTINISGGANTYTATTNGWLCISKKSSACRYIKTVINNSTLGQTTIVSGSVPGTIYHCQPVPAGKTVSILLDADSQARYYFYPCLGNV